MAPMTEAEILALEESMAPAAEVGASIFYHATYSPAAAIIEPSGLVPEIFI